MSSNTTGSLYHLRERSRERLERRAVGASTWTVNDALRARAVRRQRMSMIYSMFALAAGAAVALSVAAASGLL